MLEKCFSGNPPLECKSIPQSLQPLKVQECQTVRLQSEDDPTSYRVKFRNPFGGVLYVPQKRAHDLRNATLAQESDLQKSNHLKAQERLQTQQAAIRHALERLQAVEVMYAQPEALRVLFRRTDGRSAHGRHLGDQRPFPKKVARFTKWKTESGGVAMYAPLKGPWHSSTRAELIAATVGVMMVSLSIWSRQCHHG